VPPLRGGAPAVSVSIPATTANVGCAFDCAGIALGLYLQASATATPSGWDVAYDGPDAGQIPRDASNIMIQAMRRVAMGTNAELLGVRVEVRNDIPLGVGLGSSAAAIVAGVLLGAKLCRVDLSAAGALRAAQEIEGHPDNIAAAIHGGFVVAATTNDGVLTARAEVSTALDFVAVIPAVPLPTEKARAALPAHYSRSDVVHNLQRTALLAAAFFSGQGLAPELFSDLLHQPYRSPLVPGIAECLAFRHPGLAGIFLSGAGSAVMAIARHSAGEIGEALVGEFRDRGVQARALLLKADNEGAQIGTPSGMRPLRGAPSAPARHT
jgi:homoserine kinase